LLHQYADDLQVYISTTVDDSALAVDRLALCLADMEAWLKASRLRLNPTKTQIMWLGSQQLLARLDIVLIACFVVHHPYSAVSPRPGRGD